MGSQSVERKLKRLDHGDRRAAESCERKGYPSRAGGDAPDAAQSFDRSYAQTNLRMLMVIRGEGSIRSQIYRRSKDPFAFIKSRCTLRRTSFYRVPRALEWSAGETCSRRMHSS